MCKLKTARSKQTALNQHTNPAHQKMSCCCAEGGNKTSLPRLYAMHWEHAAHWGNYCHVYFRFYIYGTQSTWAGRGSVSYKTLNTEKTQL